MNLTEYDLGWVVGIIEGEGSFGYVSSAQYPTRYIRIRVASTDLDILERLHELLGGTIAVHGEARDRRKASWVWTIAGVRAAELARLIGPYMHSRRRARVEQLLTGVDESFNLGKSSQR